MVLRAKGAKGADAGSGKELRLWAGDGGKGCGRCEAAHAVPVLRRGSVSAGERGSRRKTNLHEVPGLRPERLGIAVRVHQSVAVVLKRQRALVR